MQPLGLNFRFPTECSGPHGGVAETVCLMMAKLGVNKCSVKLEGRLGNSTERTQEGVWQCERVRHDADVLVVVNAEPGTLETGVSATPERPAASCPATRSAGDGDGEHPGEELGPPDLPGLRRRRFPPESPNDNIVIYNKDA